MSRERTSRERDALFDLFAELAPACGGHTERTRRMVLECVLAALSEDGEARPQESLADWLKRNEITNEATFSGSGSAKHALSGLPQPMPPLHWPSRVGAVYEQLLLYGCSGGGVGESGDRRAQGAHFTPPALARDLVARTLAGSNAALGRVCDPTMGSGVFLVEVMRLLAEERGVPAAEIVNSIYGMDRDALAVWLARRCLARYAAALGAQPEQAEQALLRQLIVADTSLEVRPAERAADPPLSLQSSATLCLETQLPEVFAAGGFDVLVGNPPWVAYAGRAAQPLAPLLRSHYQRTSAAFAGYRTLHGIFAERGAALLRPGGRLGLLVPTSMADLDGYRPARLAHDAWAQVDPELPDYGADAFGGVFQPAMGLISTRRSARIEPVARQWSLRRDDQDPVTQALIARLARLPKVGADWFGERGFQTHGSQKQLLGKEPTKKWHTPLSSGTDVRPFELCAPSYYVDSNELGPGFRPAAAWREVDVLLRQTARFPIAVVSDGRAFRNSVIAGFARAPLTAHGLAAYCNSTLVRFFHYQTHRDARQGMPQLKISHLRSMPAPPSSLMEGLNGLGLEAAKSSVLQREQVVKKIDELVAAAFELSGVEQEQLRAFGEEQGRIPEPRLRRSR